MLLISLASVAAALKVSTRLCSTNVRPAGQQWEPETGDQAPPAASQNDPAVCHGGRNMGF